MFFNDEYDILKEISKLENIKVIYVLTHSSADTNKKQIINKINENIIRLVEEHPKELNSYISLRMNVFEDNCIFINFHQDNNKPIYGCEILFSRLYEYSKK